ncbi:MULTISPECIES: HlyD family efflux transporter periplasmic adaptor subunit [unclassified Brenneria]|uniref:HlyD family secretion protein n=1 Tax=unclassified Brenneria TaxID=2634434 RepID=UPI0029C476BF|nr:MULTISPECIES: HlyD family efflux transporter periplasmic adaptor subunit [unclassified Brenneria]MDX5627107.1 HlyD family efflux transporter periplasmic adaptor subunit [Brenneria sp. L3-3Z]MDX5693543.1 HlyD family efflux transporter periplasmic adaptor subunit [Brenneria sp. L4-2C]
MNQNTHEGTLSLFRHEAISARGGSCLGKSIMVRPLGTTFLIGASTLATVLVLSFLIFGEYTNRVKVAGLIQPTSGIVRVYASRSGYVTRINVREDSTVTRGSLLLSIAPDDRTAIGGTQENILLQLRSQRSELTQEMKRRAERESIEKPSLQRQAASLSKEIDRIDQQISQYDSYLREMRLAYENYKSYADKGLINKSDLLDRYETYQNVFKNFEELKKERIQTTRKLDETTSRLVVFDSKTASEISEISRQIASIDKEIAASESLREVDISAPASGTITSILFRSGQYVSVGTPLLSILPTSSNLEVYLFAKSSQIGFLKTGARVSLRYSSYPYQKFGTYPGTVTTISRAPIAEKISDAASQEVQMENQSSALYRIVVKPDSNHVIAYGQNEPLRAGMAVEADILLETRRIYEWLFEPILGFRGL